jgi:hypothetical protein
MGEPLKWRNFFGHSFRFRKSVLASPSRIRGLGKGATSPPSLEMLSNSLVCSSFVLKKLYRCVS